MGVIWVGGLDTPELPCTCLIYSVRVFCWNKLKLGCRLALKLGEYGLLHKTTIRSAFDSPTSCIYRGSKASFPEGRVLILNCPVNGYEPMFLPHITSSQRIGYSSCDNSINETLTPCCHSTGAVTMGDARRSWYFAATIPEEPL